MACCMPIRDRRHAMLAPRVVPFPNLMGRSTAAGVVRVVGSYWESRNYISDHMWSYQISQDGGANV